MSLRAFVTDVFAPADKTLKDRIGTVESALLDEKKAVLKEYFDEASQEKELDFLEFDSLGIKVLLSGSVNKLKDEITETVERIADEVKIISDMEHADEILVEYKQSLSLTNSITTVTDRKKRLEEERLCQEKLRQAEEERLEQDRLRKERGRLGREQFEEAEVIEEPSPEEEVEAIIAAEGEELLFPEEETESEELLFSEEVVAECELCGTQFFAGDTAYRDPHVSEYLYCEDCIQSWKVEL